MTRRLLFSWGLIVLALGAWLIISAPMSSGRGQLIKGSFPDVYYLADDGKRYVFPNEHIFFSWYADFSDVQPVSDDELAAYPLGGRIYYRPGTHLVKIVSLPDVYAVEPGGLLRHIASESIAHALWGDAWATRVDDVADVFFSDYTIGPALAEAGYPEGSLLVDAIENYYVIRDGELRRLSVDGIAENRINTEHAVFADISEFDRGLDLKGADQRLSDTAQLMEAPSSSGSDSGSGSGASSGGTGVDYAELGRVNVILEGGVESHYILSGQTDPEPMLSFSISNGLSEALTLDQMTLSGFIDEGEGDHDFLLGADDDGDSIRTAFSDVVSSLHLVSTHTGEILGELGVSSRAGRFTFEDLDLVIPALSSLNVRAEVVLRDAVPVEFGNDRIALDVLNPEDDLVFLGHDDLDIDDEGPNGGIQPSVMLTVAEHGTLTIEGDGSFVPSIVVSGIEETLYRFTLTAGEEEDMRLDTLTMRVMNPLAIRSVGEMSVVAPGVEATSFVPEAGVTFRDLGIIVPADDEVEVDVRVVPATTGEGAISGDPLALSFNPSTLSVSGVASGKTFGEDAIGDAITVDVLNGETTTVRRNRPLLSNVGGITTGQSSSVQTPMLRFALSSQGQGAAEIDRLRVKIVTSDVGDAGEDLLEALAQVNGDALDDDGVLVLEDTETGDYLAQGGEGSIEFSIYKSSLGLLDTTPSDRTTSTDDYGIVDIEFDPPLYARAEAREYVLYLNTDGIAEDVTSVHLELLGGADLLWSDGMATGNNLTGSGLINTIIGPKVSVQK